MIVRSPDLHDDTLGLSLNPFKAAKQVAQWAVGKGNRPGTPESRKGIVVDEQAAISVVPTIGGVPYDQAIMLGGFALAALILTQPKRRK